MKYLIIVGMIVTSVTVIIQALYIHKHIYKRQKKTNKISFDKVNRIVIPPHVFEMIEANEFKAVKIFGKMYYEEGCDIEEVKRLAAGKQSVSE